ncbi:lysophospholipid acyltransferase family protein [Haliea sp. E17]|uniref:lysophospholipid acyltransferase family protein n=1 Tax=Haliea sp. E17 TaxID=3401576 RepID=UPI003AAE25A8
MAEFILGNSLRKLARARPTLQKALWRLDYCLIWLLVKGFGIVPIDNASGLGNRVGRWIGPRLRKKSKIFRANLAVAFPEKSAAELAELERRAWGQAGRVLAEYTHLEELYRDHERMQLEILEPVETYRHPEVPAVFVGAHLSNWEIMAAAIARMGIPFASLYSPPTNPLLDRMLRDSRQALNCELLPRDNSTRALLRCLHDGRSVGMVIDRRVDEGSPVPFFGADKLSTLVPARLALKHGCDMVPVRVLRLGGARFRVLFYPPVRPADAAADAAEQAGDMTRQVHRLFEEWIHEQPEDWFCSKRMWAKRKIAPPESAVAADQRCNGAGPDRM